MYTDRIEVKFNMNQGESWDEEDFLMEYSKRITARNAERERQKPE